VLHALSGAQIQREIFHPFEQADMRQTEDQQKPKTPKPQNPK
jgi:hypothetical protein